MIKSVRLGTCYPCSRVVNTGVSLDTRVRGRRSTLPVNTACHGPLTRVVCTEPVHFSFACDGALVIDEVRRSRPCVAVNIAPAVAVVKLEVVFVLFLCCRFRCLWM